MHSLNNILPEKVNSIDRFSSLDVNVSSLIFKTS
jgi:hypothetical protein